MEINIITWVGFSQALFAAILMLTKSERRMPDKILTGWLVLLAIEFLTTGLDFKIYGLPLLSSSFLLLNPAFFLYIKSLTNKRFQIKWLHLLHLAPFIILETVAYIINEPFTLKEYFDPDKTLWFRYAFSISTLISWLAYNYASIMMVHRHRISLKNEFSTIERNKKLGWLLFVVVAYNLFCAASIFIGIMVILFNSKFLLPLIFNYSNLLAMVYVLSIYGLRQRMIYQTIYPQSDTVDQKYSRSGMKDQRKTDIKNIMTEYFIKEKPYLNPDLNMQMLSENLKIPKHQITEVLNTEIGKNFFQYVNEYRIEAVKQMLAIKDHPWSIEAIGYECGFNSKSTFFTVFRNFTGMTPSIYRESLLK